jgi:hypothetical protein
MRNSVVNAAPDRLAISLFLEGPSTVSFSTIVGRLPCGLAAANNIIVNSAGAQVDSVDTSGASCGHAYSLITPQANAPTGPGNLLNMNPLFVDGTVDDYHLRFDSPAIDAADPVAIDTVDYDGVTRPQGPRRDIGAFEYKP